MTRTTGLGVSNFAGSGGRAAGALRAVERERVVSSILRLQRNFWP